MDTATHIYAYGRHKTPLFFFPTCVAYSFRIIIRKTQGKIDLFPTFLLSQITFDKVYFE